jgi:hypothetical protein
LVTNCLDFISHELISEEWLKKIDDTANQSDKMYPGDIWKLGNKIIVFVSGGAFIGNLIAQIPGAIIGGIIAAIYASIAQPNTDLPS